VRSAAKVADFYNSGVCASLTFPPPRHPGYNRRMSEEREHSGVTFVKGMLIGAMLVLVIWSVIQDLSASPRAIPWSGAVLLVVWTALFSCEVRKIRKSEK
jgi:hypothetical protein